MTPQERAAFDALKRAAERFVWKCENAQASSRESYAQFKAALALVPSPSPDTAEK